MHQVDGSCAYSTTISLKSAHCTLIFDLVHGWLQVVGSIPELGNWETERAPSLKYEDGTQSFVAVVPLEYSLSTATGSSVEFEYKIAVSKPGVGEGGKSEPWEWQPGPNRRYKVSSPGAEHVAPAAARLSAVARVRPMAGQRTQLPHFVKEAWYHARDGTQVIDSDGYLEPHRGHLQLRWVGGVCASRYVCMCA